MDGFIKLSQKTLKKNKRLADIIKNEFGFEKLYKEYISNQETIQYKQNLINNLDQNNSYIQTCIKKILDVLRENLYIEQGSDIENYKNLSLKMLLKELLLSNK